MILSKNSKFIVRDDLSIGWLVWFGICLFPLAIEQNGVGMSANYLFALTPLVYILAGGKLTVLPKMLSTYFLLCSIIFLISIIYQVSYIEHGVRRISSFIIFITVLSLPTINFTNKMIFSFYYSIVGVSVLISTMAIVGVIKFGLINPAELKGEVGTQRIGFLYLFGFWMLIYFITIERNGVFRKIFLATLIIIILSGIVLTFSRAAYLSFVISVCFYFYLKIRVLKLSINQISQILISILILFLSFVVLGLIYPELYEFIDNRFFLIFRDGNLVLTLSDSETSEGYRLSTWMEIFYFVISNPFTGSGFLGSWVYLPDQGSAHSEYIDRFGRLGIIGFLFYLFMLGKIYSFLLEKYRYLFISFTGAITYGFFHETFSLSHGAAIFSFILMLYAKFCRADSSTNRNAV